MDVSIEHTTLGPETLAGFRLHYDRKYDILVVQQNPPRPAIGLDLTEEVWLHVDPLSNELVSVSIENFQRGFLKAHPALVPLWIASQRRLSSGKSDELASFLAVLGQALCALAVRPPEHMHAQAG